MPGSRSIANPPPPSPGRGTRPVPRRAVLSAGAVGLATLGLSACGSVRLGSPAPYTPPAEGIDDIYRHRLLDLLSRQRDATAQGVTIPPGASEQLSGQLRELHSALIAQHDALLTGSEAQKQSATASAAGTASAAPSMDLSALLGTIGDLQRLAADACVQCSGSLARVVAAIASHQTWAAGRLAVAAADPAVTAPAPPAEQDIHPTQTVPRSDPASVAAKSDYQAALQQAQNDEWYAGYVQEVRAARSTDATARQTLLASSTAHRERAARLTTMAEQDRVAPASQQPVYPLPDAGVEPALDALPASMDQALVADWVALTGAVPFAGRAFAIATALAEAAALAPEGGAISALPSLDDKES